MTFPNRNLGGTGVYAHSLLDRVQRQGEVTTSEIAGPGRSNFVATLAWLLAGARRALRQRPADILHCPGFVAPWFVPIPVVVTVHDAGGRRFPDDHPLEWRAYDRAFIGGRVPAEELPALVSRASLVVYPSLYEGFGFPPLEAMAVGTPVVASDRGSLPEVLGDAALLVDPDDGRALTQALEAVLQRPDLGQRLRDAGRARARLYSWERCAEATTQVYREVAASGQGRR